MSRPEPCPPEVLADARWALVRDLLQHLPHEDRHLYQRLHRDPRPEVAATVAHYKAEAEPIYASFQSHMERWRPDLVQTRWSDYCAASLPLLAMLEERLAAEEAELYPLLANAPAGRGERSPTDRNWAGDATALRARILG